MDRKLPLKIRDRVVELRRVKASELRANPKNWRKHPAAQAGALRGILTEVGFAGAVLARETPEGLELIDGHLRVEEAGDEVIPVLILDVTEEEADKLLAVYDPIGAMAEADAEELASLLKLVETDDEGLQGVFDGLLDAAEIVVGLDEDLGSEKEGSQIKSLPTDRPPAMTWTLIGIPTVRYVEISEYVESMSAITGTFVEVGLGDAKTEED